MRKRVFTLAATAALAGSFALAMPATSGAQVDLGDQCEALGLGSDPTTINLVVAEVTITTCNDVAVPSCTFTERTITVAPLVRATIRYCSIEL